MEATATQIRQLDRFNDSIAHTVLGHELNSKGEMIIRLSLAWIIVSRRGYMKRY